MRAGFLDLKTGKLYQFLADSLTEETLLDLSDNDPVKQAAFNKAETRLMGLLHRSKLEITSPRPFCMGAGQDFT